MDVRVMSRFVMQRSGSRGQACSARAGSVVARRYLVGSHGGNGECSL